MSSMQTLSLAASALFAAAAAQASESRPWRPQMVPRHGPTEVQCFCPKASDLQWDYGEGKPGNEIRDGGWTITEDGRVSSKGVFNLLGGYVEYDIDISRTAIGVNSNVYGVFPFMAAGDFDALQYCDAQPISPVWCPEMDFVENNGPVAWTSTWHTVPGRVPNGTRNSAGCDEKGCYAARFYQPPFHYKAQCTAREPAPMIDSSRTYTIRTSFDELTGDMNVTFKQGATNVNMAGDSFLNDLGSAPDSYDRSIVKQFMEERGLAMVSSLWVGWVPAAAICPSYDATPEGSSFSVSNLRFAGKLIRGSASTCPCSAQVLV
jgi:hypothetical protein